MAIAAMGKPNCENATVGFDTLPDWAEFVAQDGDGTWWAYEVHLNRHDHGWYENEVGRFQRLKKQAPNPDWERALIRLKK